MLPRCVVVLLHQSGGYRINSKKSKGPPASVSSSIVYFVSLDLSENELTCTGIEVIVVRFEVVASLFSTCDELQRCAATAMVYSTCPHCSVAGVESVQEFYF